MSVQSYPEGDNRFAQTFVPTRTGRIYAVDLLLAWYSWSDPVTPPTDLTVAIHALDQDGHPTGAPLGSGTVSSAGFEQDVPAPLHLDLDTPAPVDGGATYALVVSMETPQTPDAGGAWFVFGSSGDAYPDGKIIQDWNHEGWFDFTPSGSDIVFRTHLGDPV